MSAVDSTVQRRHGQPSSRLTSQTIGLVPQAKDIFYFDRTPRPATPHKRARDPIFARVLPLIVLHPRIILRGDLTHNGTKMPTVRLTSFSRSFIAGAALIGVAAGHADADFLNYEVVATGFFGDDLVKYEVYAVFNGPTDTLLEAFHLNRVAGSQSPSFYHLDFWSGGVHSNSAGSWDPNLTLAANARDSYVMIGGTVGAGTNNGTSADAGWGSAGFLQAQVPFPTAGTTTLGPGWISGDTVVIQGQVDLNGRVKVAQFMLEEGKGAELFLKIGYWSGVFFDPVRFGQGVISVGCNGADSDGDGWRNACDNCPETANVDQGDFDWDGVGDVCDGCPKDYLKDSPGICGCGVTDLDSDEDGTADCNDTTYNRVLTGGVIPNNSATGLARTFTVGADTFPLGIGDVKATFTGLAHTFAGDLIAELVAPDGTTEYFFYRIGKTAMVPAGDNSNFIAANVYKVGDSYPGSLWTNAAAAVGTSASIAAVNSFPTGPMSGANVTMSAGFLAASTAGVWTMRIKDAGGSDLSAGSITSMSITLTRVLDTDLDGISDFNDNCPLVINYNQMNSDGDAMGNACDGCPNDGSKTLPGACGCGVPDTDTDLDGIADCNDLVLVRTVLGGTIPNNNPTGFTVNFEVPASAMSTPLVDVKVKFTGLSHPFAGDLKCTLSGPAGQNTTVFDRVGKTSAMSGAGDNSNFLSTNVYSFGDTYTGSVWTNAATAAGTAADIAGSPCFATGALSANKILMAPALGSLITAGTWSLTISDLGNTDTFAGSFVKAKITFTRASALTGGTPSAPTEPSDDVLAALSDGVLDIPGEFASAQEAINALPAQSQATIALAAGVYSGAIDFLGKDVELRGAGIGQTVLDGSGVVGAMVNLDNTPNTAVLADLSIRAATDGAVSGNNSRAAIEGVRFESNFSATGGAVMLTNSWVSINECEFVSNQAANDGGAIFLSSCDGSIMRSVFTANRCATDGEGSGSALAIVGAASVDGAFIVKLCTISGNDGGAAVSVRDALDGTLGRCVLNASLLCGNSPHNFEGDCTQNDEVSCADVNRSGAVDAADMTALMNSWGSSDALADIDGDGIVGASDLAILLGVWGDGE